MVPALPPTGAQPLQRRPWAQRYGMAIVCCAGFIALQMALREVLHTQPPFIALLAAPLLASWLGGWGPGTLATVLCALIGELLLKNAGDAGNHEWVQLLLFMGYGLLFSGFNEARLRSLRIATARQENLLRAQQELALREQRMRETLEASPAGMLVVHRDGRIALVNGQAERMFGFTREQLVGQSVDRLLPAQLRDAHADNRAHFHAHPTARAMGAGRAVRALRSDGSEFPVEVGLTPLHDTASGLVVASVIDISARQKAEEALRETDRRKDEFIAVLAHELRNPLAPVRSAVDILRRLDPGDPRFARTREVIARQVGHMARLIDDLLDVSHMARGKLALRITRCDLGQITRDTAEDYRATLEAAGLRLLVDAPETPIWVDGDAVRLAQLLGNLLNNARRFSHPGGLITVEARADPVARKALMRVADTGVGIEGALLSRLFNPFEQAAQDFSRSRGGLGLGLALTKALAELHGGHIEAASPGTDQGTTVTLHLPLAPVTQNGDADGAAPARAAPTEGKSGKTLRILVVEDNPDAAETLGELLELAGHEVTVCHDGEAGLALADQLQPHVVISDLGLPGEINGYQLAQRLRAQPRLAGLCLIALSGYADSRARARSQAAGFDEHLPKPPDIHQLERLLERVARAA